MAVHRMNCRRSGIRPGTDRVVTSVDPVARGVSVEETFVPSVDVLPKPDGFGTEASTTSTTFEEIEQYTVPAGSVGRLRELALSIESNGEAKVTVAGTTYGPFTGAVDVSVPLDDGVLPPGYQIRAHHQSTDGNSTTTRATVVVLEV